MNRIMSRDQIRRVDRLALEAYAMQGIVLMENAGRNATDIIRRHYGDRGSAFIVCGVGNNGGDGCVIARHLSNFGWDVGLLVVGDPAKMTEDMSANFRIVEAMDLPRWVVPDGERALPIVERVRPEHVVIDCLLGTGFEGEVRSPLAELIERLNEVPKRVMVAIDVPSGLDCQSGLPSNATVVADLTITFVAVKEGFQSSEAVKFVGKVEVADIGVPKRLIEEVASGQR
ncbi:MAG: NAD(P)H-hydrate epimerase [Phycisphaerales bacterium]|nr:MAG: NAD(P)H-hydrate epimerase [Phycisphaerales bacterium]